MNHCPSNLLPEVFFYINLFAIEFNGQYISWLGHVLSLPMICVEALRSGCLVLLGPLVLLGRLVSLKALAE